MRDVRKVGKDQMPQLGSFKELGFCLGDNGKPLITFEQGSDMGEYVIACWDQG